MKNKMVLITILATMSSISMANEGHKGQLSFIPKVAIGENRRNDDMDFKVKGFAGFNADVLYGVTDNLEMGVNLGWSQYDLNDMPKEMANLLDEEFGITPSKNDWDQTLDNLSLVGVVRYNFTELESVTPYITGRAGWSFGKASGDVEFTSNGNDYTLDT
uniref:Outer membrane protein beta-barrel domain-containing protein n=1 Tax=Hirondellea gigas TaxID=1518452 RepID=A0A6A7GC77_9CRUS